MLARIDIKRSTLADPDFQALLLQLNAELNGRYGEEQAKFDKYNVLDSTARVVIAYQNNQPVGCGCFRTLANPETIEIKRMYVKPALRGHGVARVILQTLENWAREEEFKKVLLETGIKQPEAIASYARAGYSIIENYGPYKNSSYSVCMQKDLG